MLHVPRCACPFLLAALMAFFPACSRSSPPQVPATQAQAGNVDLDDLAPYRLLARECRDALQRLAARPDLNPVERGEVEPVSWSAVSNTVVNLVGDILDGNLAAARHTLRRQQGRAEQTELQAFWADLGTRVEFLEQRREAALKTFVSNALEAAQGVCLKAKNAGDLAPALDRLRTCQGYRSQGWRDTMQPEWNRLDSGLNFLQQFQLYLAARDANYTTGMQQALNSLLNSSYLSTRLLSHAEILAFAAPEDADDWVRPLLKKTTPDTLTDTIRTITEQSGIHPGPYANQAYNIIYSLNALAAAHLHIRSGRPGTGLNLLASAAYNWGSWGADIEPLIFAVEREWITTVTGLAPGDLPGDLPPPLGLEKLADQACADQDWPRAEILLAALADLRPGQSERAGARLLACRALLAGQRLEAAGDSAAAADSYRDALKAQGPLMPHEVAAAALRRLAGQAGKTPNPAP